MSSLNFRPRLPAPFIPGNFAQRGLDTAPKIPSPLRNTVHVDDQDQDISTAHRCDSVIDDSGKAQTNMTLEDLYDFLSVDDATDNLATLPQLTENRLKVHPSKPHDYDGYPMLVQSDVDDSYKRKDLVHDPDKHAPWAPFDDGDSKLTMAHVEHKTRYEDERVSQLLYPDRFEAPAERSWVRAVMSNRLKPEFARRVETCNKRQPRSDQEDQFGAGSIVNAAAEVLLQLSASSEQFTLPIESPENSPPSTPRNSQPPSSELDDSWPSATPTSTKAVSLEDLDAIQLERERAMRAIKYMPPSPPSSTDWDSPEISMDTYFNLLHREPEHPLGLQPLRRIARCEAHTQRPAPGKQDHRPAWAKRGGPPSDDLKAAQRKVHAFAIKMWQSFQDKDRDTEMNASGFQNVSDMPKVQEDLMKPLWRRRGAGVELTSNDQGVSCADDSLLRFWKMNEPKGGLEDDFVSPGSKENEKYAMKKKTECSRWEAYTSRWVNQEESDDDDASLLQAAEEYEFFTEEHEQLDEIFDEPDRPIGAFNGAEVDHYVERQRQQEIKKFRAAGATHDQLEEYHQNKWSRSCAEMDEAAIAARKALEASRQLVPKAQPKSRSTSPLKKRKRESDDETEPLLKRPQRQRKPTERAAEEPSPSGSPKRQRESDDETESLDQRPQRQREPTEKAEHLSPEKAQQRSPVNPQHHSPSPSPKTMMVTLKFKGKALRSFPYSGPFSGIEDGAVEREIMDGVVEKLASKLIEDAVDGFERK